MRIRVSGVVTLTFSAVRRRLRRQVRRPATAAQAPIGLDDCTAAIALLLAAATALASAPRSVHEGWDKARMLLTTMAAPEWNLVACAVGCAFPGPP